MFTMPARTEREDKKQKFRTRLTRRLRDDRGASLLEMAFLLPILVVLAFGVIDLGRLIHARLVVTNVSREGGSIASRGILTPATLITMLQSSATPFDLVGQGRIYVIDIRAGTQASPPPFISSKVSAGAYNVNSSITGNPPAGTPGGLSPALYNHLVFKTAQNAPDIAGVSVVEVFYLYRPITPLPQFVQNLVLPTGGILIGSKAVF
jgi:hypothetical protein